MSKDNQDNFIFRNMKIYASTEWLADNKKQYRTVFEKGQTSYIYCEFSIFNLQFKKQDWDLKLNLICLNHKNEELCNLDCSRKVSKDSNLIYIREGFGTPIEGSFWKEGSYIWRAMMGDKIIAERNFFIQDIGLLNETQNDFFDIKSVKFYEGNYENIKVENRKYFEQFPEESTRYVWVEFNGINKVENREFWASEFVFNFRTANNMLKGSITKSFFVYPQDKEFVVEVGWGSDQVGSWLSGNYQIDILFLDHLIASAPFKIGKDFQEKIVKKSVVLKTESLVKAVSDKKVKKRNIGHVLSELDDLIGLTQVKERVREYSSYLEYIAIRRDKGIPEEDELNLHCVFRGNPGTGKTTLARKLGKIYKELGLLSKGHVHEVDRSDLVAEFIGQTAPKTKAAIKKAQGGILFIDEAYSLARKDDDSKDFGKEAIEALLKELSDGKDISIIVAGYPEEMDTFISSNPGLKSRFRMNYDFPDYTPQELMEICKLHAEKKSITLSVEAEELLYKKWVDVYRERDRFFGNARLVVSTIDEIKLKLGIRVMSVDDPSSLSIEDLSLVLPADVESLSLDTKSMIADIPVDEELLAQSLKKIEGLIGLDSVKTEVKNLVDLVRYYKETDSKHKVFSLHSVFTGNPGTGKTTVARILAQIFKALGILERGHLVECDRESLIGGYVGQTAIKTGEVIDRAMGGVLFIDEAYSLTEGGGGDYGREAIEIILKRMEDFRGNFIVIAAGYTQNMRNFLESNPGLKSRFDKVFQFDDFNPSELSSIAINQFNDVGLNPNIEASKFLTEMLSQMHDSRDKYFGNGRSVRKIVAEATKNQHLRMSKLKADKRTKKAMETLTKADLQSIEIADKSKPDVLSKLGFRRSN